VCCGGGGAMTINFFNSIYYTPSFGGLGNGSSNTGYALDSNFTLGSAGDCVGLRFSAPVGNVHIHSVYFFIHAANATSHDLTCSLTGYNSASATRADSTAIRSVTAAGGTTSSKWIKFDFSAYTDALTSGDIYWLVIGDTTGSGSSYSIRTSTAAQISNNSSVSARFYAMYSNDAGFSTNGTSANSPCPCIIVFSDGSVFGQPYTNGVNSASSSLERGLKFIFDEKIICGAVALYLNSTNVSTLQIYSGDTAPNGTVWSGFNSGNAYTFLTSQKSAIGFAIFPSPVTFEKNTVYRITMKASGAHTSPGYNEIEDVATLETAAALLALGGGSWCHTIDNGAGGWTDYNNATDGYRLSRMSLIMQSQVPITSGGGCYSFGG
jgi:hypothetical protein